MREGHWRNCDFDHSRGSAQRMSISSRAALLTLCLIFNPAGGSLQADASASAPAREKTNAVGRAPELVDRSVVRRFDVFQDRLQDPDAATRHAAADELVKVARSSTVLIEPTGGIGVLISDNWHACGSSGLLLTSILEGSPAHIARLRAEDHLVEVDGARACSLPVEEVRRRLRGPIGSKVAVTVGQGWGGSSLKHVTLTRAALGETDPRELLSRLVSEALENPDAYVKDRAREACNALAPRPMVCRARAGAPGRTQRKEPNSGRLPSGRSAD